MKNMENRTPPISIDFWKNTPRIRLQFYGFLGYPRGNDEKTRKNSSFCSILGHLNGSVGVDDSTH